MTTGIRKTDNNENIVVHTEDNVASGMNENNQTQAIENGSTFAATTQSITNSEHDTTHTTAPITQPIPALGGLQTETNIDLGEEKGAEYRRLQKEREQKRAKSQ